MSQSRLQEVARFGQSIWYDNISRSIVREGLLKRMVDDDGLGGVTSNPTIFMKAVAESAAYDADIRRLAAEGKSAGEIVHLLMVGDIREAADVLRPVYDRASGDDGFVSIEVSPHLAYQVEATVAEGLHLFKEVGRPNVMIKVPGTAEGARAGRMLLVQGVNVNFTLLFAPEHYRRVAESYIEAIEERDRGGLPLDAVRSVASFFLSRIDTTVDKLIDRLAVSQPERAGEIKKLRGQAAVAVAKVTYGEFKALFFSPRFQNLVGRNAKLQRPLWASTGTKDPAYSDLKYVDSLIGPHTVNTLPQATLDAFRDHGRPAASIEVGAAEAPALLARLETFDISMEAVYRQLQEDGVKAFVDSFEQLVATVQHKMA